MAPRRLSLLSFNIQAGATTRRYREYVTRGWTHVLPAKAKRGNLDNIARVASEFDVVGLQEADPGSLRSSFLNQTHYLAEQAAFPYWSHQANRRVGGIASSANGLLSRIEPVEVQDHALPSRIPGRGALVVRYGPELDHLVVVIAHLSLSIKARIPQLAYIADLVSDAPNAVLMGDFNCEPRAREMETLYRRTTLRCPEHAITTFPSWEPRRAIDHILVSDGLSVVRRWRINEPLSDHLGIACEVHLPPLPPAVPSSRD